jgi:glycosyltransferase involved in cell wall biosynthesis
VRILVVSNIYPPVVRGGYEVECSGVVERLRASGHDVHVLTSSLDAPAPRPGVTATLPFLWPDLKGTLRAPRGAFTGVAEAGRALEVARPDLVWVWNGAALPHTAIHTLATSGVPLAFRVCEHWFSRVLREDRFTAHLEGGETGARDRAWGAVMRLLNRHPRLRVDPGRPITAAVSWNSAAIREMAPAPPVVRIAYETVLHSTSRKLPALEAIVRAPSATPTALFLGRKDSLKGADVAVRAVARLRREHGLELRLVLAGPWTASATPRGSPSRRAPPTSSTTSRRWTPTASRVSSPRPTCWSSPRCGPSPTRW